MFIDKDSIVINGISIGQYIVQATFEYNKLWAEDSGRNLAGTMSGSLVGIFPKIILQFRKLTKEELELIVPIIDSKNQTVSYYDPYKQEQTTMTTYTGDWKTVNRNVIGRNNIKNDGFEVSFISVRKRQ